MKFVVSWIFIFTNTWSFIDLERIIKFVFFSALEPDNFQSDFIDLKR